MRTEMLNLVYVGMGGLLGSIGRYVVAGAVYQVFPNSYFPIGTTFSTFGYETIAAMRAGEFVPALANVLIQVIVGLSALWLGYNVTRYF